jgi:hypothetical protein
MNKSLLYDVPAASANGTQALLLDANAGQQSTLPNGKGIVYMERHAIRKQFVERQDIGTPSAVRPETYLVKETNFKDAGGGWFEFERHYAEVPAPWFSFGKATFSFRADALNNSFGWLLNPTSGPSETRQTLAKLDRFYLVEIGGQFFQQVITFEEIPGGATQMVITLNPVDLETFLKIRAETAFVVGLNPSGKILLPDEMNLWMGNIYQVTRTTGA